MILLDSNVLVHAIAESSPLFASAAKLVARGLREKGRFCIAPQNLVEFAAVVTRSRIVEKPLSPDEAKRAATLLFKSRRLSKIYPSRGTVMRAMNEGTALGITGPTWHDLYLAVTMRENGVHVVVTENKRDFDRIPFVRPQSIAEAARD